SSRVVLSMLPLSFLLLLIVSLHDCIPPKGHNIVNYGVRRVVNGVNTTCMWFGTGPICYGECPPMFEEVDRQKKVQVDPDCGFWNGWDCPLVPEFGALCEGVMGTGKALCCLKKKA
ncbi:hypothetical protein PFISCL1PPCAC_11369, partial [Pristionchus fissidentatus]